MWCCIFSTIPLCTGRPGWGKVAGWEQGAAVCFFFNSIGNIVRLSRLQKLKMPTPRAGGSAVSPAPLQADELQTNLLNHSDLKIPPSAAVDSEGREKLLGKASTDTSRSREQ